MGTIERKTKIAFGIAVFSAVLLTTATYAWMSISSALTVTDLALNVVTDNALEIAVDIDGVAGAYQNTLSLAEIFPDGVALKPVTYSAVEDAFLAPNYGLDGRIDFMSPVTLEQTQTGVSLSTSSEAAETVDGGYMLAFDFWARTGTDNCTIVLSDPMPVTEELPGGGTYVVGAPVWNADTVSHEDGGSGAQYAIRIGFRTYNEDGTSKSFYVYEPNYEGEDTPSIDGTGIYVSDEQLITQSPSTWVEQDPVLRDNVDYVLGEIDQTNNRLFSLDANVEQKVTLYIWLEGQDVDCTNMISAAELAVNIQFSAVVGEEEGDDIESR